MEEIRYQSKSGRFVGFIIDNISSELCGFAVYSTLWFVSDRFLQPLPQDKEFIDIIIILIGLIAFLFFDFLNRIIFPLISKGASLGKLIVGSRVVREDGRRVNITKLIGRWVVQMLVLIFGMIGLIFQFVIISNDSKYRSIHDQIAGTVVIKSAPISLVYTIFILLTLVLVVAYSVIIIQ